MEITLKNNFHNTEATIRMKRDWILTPSQVRRVRTKLCGLADCVCSGYLGIRGPQEVDIEEIEHGIFRLSPNWD